MKKFRHGLMLALLCCFATHPALAIHSGHVQGHVYDERGKPLQDATVTISGKRAVGTWTCRTDDRGFYRIAGLDASRELTIKVEAEGRQTIERGGYRLRDDQTMRFNVRLRPVGVFYTLVITDPRVPYHRTALAGAQQTLPPGMRVFEAKNSSRRTLRKLRRALNSHPDAVLAIGSLPALLARQTVTDIPVVYTMVLDPEKEKLTYENMCGVAANGAYSEQLDILEQMAPTVRKIGTLFAPERLDGVVRQLRTEATEMGFQLEARPVHKPGELMMQLRSLKDSGVEALMLLLDPGLWTLDAFHKARAFAQEHEIIFIVPDGSMVRAGATFSFGPGFEELGAYAGRLATNLVEKKVTTAEIGMIYPSTRYFSVNPQDLDRFDLKMPASLYSQGAMTGAPRIILAPGKISD